MSLNIIRTKDGEWIKHEEGWYTLSKYGIEQHVGVVRESSGRWHTYVTTDGFPGNSDHKTLKEAQQKALELWKDKMQIQAAGSLAEQHFDLAPKVGKGDVMFCDFCEQNHDVQEDHPSSQYILCKGKMQLVGIYGRMLGQ